MFASLVLYLCKREQYKEYMIANLLIILTTVTSGKGGSLKRRPEIRLRFAG